MVASTFDAALRRLLVHEGGYGNHPSDPGGPTNFGITIADYRRYVKPDATAADVKAMRVEEAKAIYRAQYWDSLRCDSLPAGLDYAVFDYGVNSGVGRAAKVLRRLVGFPEQGKVDDALLAAVRKRDTHETIARLCDERLGFLQRLKTWPVFGAGWGRRVREVRAAALAMTAQPDDALQAKEAAPGKAVAPAGTAARNAAAAGVVVAGATAAQQAHQAGVHPLTVAAILCAAAAFAAGAWFGWRWVQRRRQAAA